VIPCECGKILHFKDAIYCGWCTKKLNRKPTFPTKIKILITNIVISMWKRWLKKKLGA